MLARQRQELILREVEENGGVRVSELVTTLGVSDMTVRRDIETLAGKKLVMKVHGGATAIGDRHPDEPGFSVKSEMNPVQKSEIARTTASLIGPGSTIAVSAGTTAYAVAVELRPIKRLTVVTNSPRVAELLYDPVRDDQLVVLTGGVRTPSDALAGPVANAMLATMHVETLILGVHGIDIAAGLTTPNLQEAQTNRALIKCAQKIVVVADHSKWGVVGLQTIATLDQVDTLVTDAELGDDARRAIADLDVHLIVAPRSDHDDAAVGE
ncbi:DeoR/GlpR family DNA-binding transcription regulator [Luteipulveratus sp. YIM 133132]|uniref:DeoR/GlpR family DNA-binding transcription regulator n=1 Tax=Luteipulveratus flavus TaxID=3031728 RepID=A0ABT6C2D2_9MICO|nr:MULTISPECIES: DeoR/GlpR family DNA-binding transcription regulator [unclassified Luteipulveratus]MDE9367102.1 DeoR/GlpR family DNA-binding transcription regulator [Luteipulveratus sp. YIM 133132]MDF8263088.1 DeoR/GlpR family DNA-binding transcription regulator [Luteipulveratus sp. YIM 133296]